MKWNKYTIETTTAAEDYLSSALMDLGIEGVQIEDNVPLTKEDQAEMFIDFLPELPPDEGISYVSFYLEDNGQDDTELLKQVKTTIEEMRNVVDMGTGKITSDQTEDLDWINNWKKFFSSFYIDDILIKPTWEELKEEDRDKFLIEIDPGVSFGTGKHETTQLCIRQLLKYIRGGAHFGFSPEFPENATRLGADAVIMSVHKTLPAFTQTALLHLCSDRIAEKKVAQFLGIYETSSPSYLLMAGIEKSLQIIEKDREMLFAAYSRRLAEFRDKTKNLKTLQVLQPSDFSKQEAFSFDPGKLLILTGNSMSGQALQEILLQEYGLQMEMASGNYVVAMTSIMDTDEGFARLSDALECIDGTVHKKEETSEISPREIYREQKTVMTIDQALDAEQKTVRLEEAAGAVSGDYVYLYPPGIPILVPGEAIDVQTAETIRHCIRLGLEVEGLPDLTCINVVK